jgi:hypothetical protein
MKSSLWGSVYDLKSGLVQVLQPIAAAQDKRQVAFAPSPGDASVAMLVLEAAAGS